MSFLNRLGSFLKFLGSWRFELPNGSFSQGTVRKLDVVEMKRINLELPSFLTL